MKPAATKKAPARVFASGPWWLIVMTSLIITCAIGILAEPVSGWAALLVAAIFGIQLAIGTALFAAIHVVANAKWWNPLRPVIIRLAGTLAAPVAVLVVVLLLGTTTLYPWARGGELSHLVQEKSDWLNVPLFLARAGGILVSWFLLIHAIRGRLAAFAAEPTPENRGRIVRVSALFLIVFGLTISVAFWDWTMSLEPEWFSTMYGVYGFSGAFLGGIALIIVASAALEHFSMGKVKLTDALMHDLGKLLFGFSMFWAYIWFCQYMLIWYANIPEETTHYITRTSAGWSMIFWTNPIVNFIIPWLLLLPAWAKMNRTLLVQVAVVILAGRWIDVHLMISPAIQDAPTFPGFALAASVAVILMMGALFLRKPAKD